MPERTHYDALIIGSGAAGLNAADSLYELGVTNIAILTEGLYSSTSINTGSDKQTYYKISTTGDQSDSVYDMARTYISCGGIEGFHALTESALSLRCFFKLVEAGVPFPMNRYGEYVGYRTDHDVRLRASSCGPLTSKYMCECLIKRIKQKNIKVIEGFRAVRLLTDNGTVYGCAAIDIGTGKMIYLGAKNIIIASGGPAGIYSDSVYPICHTGGVGIALREGAKATSLSEWQYGLASTDFRWNLSGSYQQVIPKYVSVDRDGSIREFLHDYIDTGICDLIFQKGYNWPFSPKKLNGKSSVIDIAVYTESHIKGRKVYLDFRSNPSEYDFSSLGSETKEYLTKSGLEKLSTPIERLKKLNIKAYNLYKDHGIDLEKVPLAANVCAQHCNGGLNIDENYMTTIKNLYACGECAGVFGVTRPGGSALNSTQVSSLKAALSISKNNGDLFEKSKFDALKQKVSSEISALTSKTANGKKSPSEIRSEFQTLMSLHGAFIRKLPETLKALEYAKQKLSVLFDEALAKTPFDIYNTFVNEDLLLTMQAVLESQRIYAQNGYLSRGGYILCGDESLSELCKNVHLEDRNDDVVDVRLTKDGFDGCMRTVSPLPQSEQWFEKVAFGEQ